MFKKLLIAFFLFSNFANASEVWNSVDGLDRLARSQFKNDFHQLVNFYQPQINPLYCSAASSVIILNALNSGNLFKQEEFFNEKTDKIKLKSIIDFKEKDAAGNYDAGLSIADLNKILSKVYKLKTKLTYVDKSDEKSIKKFRQNIKEILAENKKFIITNFDGKVLNHKTGGHLSPIAAYDEASDSLLVLDVALHKNQWFWVDVTEFYKSMNTKDGENYRGFLVVSL
jgi:hypothetical protein